MPAVRIDEEKCTGCGSCAVVCPHKILVIEGKKAVLVAGGCMHCGHCQASCPVQAISVELPDRLGLDTIVEKEDGNYAVLPEELVHLMRMRRSCRNYTGKPVELPVLQDLVKIGTTAPSGTNCQPWQFIILPTRDALLHLGDLTRAYYKKLNDQASNSFFRFLARLFYRDALGKYYRNYYLSVKDAINRWEESGEDLLFHGATSAILVTVDTNASCPVEDGMLASQNILLAAESMDIGSCLIGFVVEAAKRDKNIGEALGIPKSHMLCSVIALGHKNEHFCRPAGRRVVVPEVKDFV